MEKDQEVVQKDQEMEEVEVKEQLAEKEQERRLEERKEVVSLINKKNEGYVMADLKNKYSVVTFTTVDGYTVKEKTLLGKKNLVVPVVMMVEGVHHGSHGPLLHLIAELGKFAGAWNGIPIVIDHPEEGGESVSANSPEILEERTVGKVFHSNVKGKKLRAEAWLEEDRLRQVSSDILAAVKASEPVEVSVGVFSDEEEEEGEFNGEQYSAIARNHRPDHLALLPGGTGACSIEDGCGIRANSNNNKKGEDNEMIRTDKFPKTFQSLKEQGYSLLVPTDNTSEGLTERLEAVRRKIDSLDSNDTYHFLHEVYDEYVVYESRLRVGESKIYKQDYSFNSGVVELTGDPVEVHKKVEYVVNNSINKFVRTKPIKNKEDNQMSEKKDCPNCLKKIDALIANEQSKFVEADRELLLTFDEATLDKLAPTEVEVEKIVEKEVKVNELGPEDKAALAYGKKQLKARRDSMTKSIQDNTSKEVWPDTVLNSMEEDTLERVYNSTKKEDETDFSLQGNGNGGDNLQVNADEVEPMFLGRGTKIKEEKEDK